MYGDYVTFAKGKLIYDLMLRNGYIYNSPKGEDKYTLRRGDDAKSVIDLVFSKQLKCVNVEIIRNVALSASDHLPVLFEVVLPSPYGKSKLKTTALIRTEKFDDVQVSKLMEHKVRQRAKEIDVKVNLLELWKVCNTSVDVGRRRAQALNDDIDVKVNEIIYQCASEVAGTRSTGVRKKSVLTENSLTRKYDALATSYHKLSLKWPSDKRLWERKSHYLDLYDKEMAKIKKERFEIFAKELATNDCGRQMKTIRLISQSRQRSVAMLQSNHQALEHAADHFQSMFTNERQPEVTPPSVWQYSNDQVCSEAAAIFDEEVIFKP